VLSAWRRSESSAATPSARDWSIFLAIDLEPKDGRVRNFSVDLGAHEATCRDNLRVDQDEYMDTFDFIRRSPFSMRR
jgi:hypothetical protein